MQRWYAAVVIATSLVAGCGEDARSGAAARSLKAVPLPEGTRVVFDGTQCGERCIRSAVLEGRPGQSSSDLRRAHESMLERSRWTRTPACASPLPQYTDPGRKVEVFLKPARQVPGGQSSTPKLSERLEDAIGRSRRAGRPTLVLEIA